MYSIPSLSFDVSLSPEKVTGVIFIVFLVATIGISAILFFHWSKYGLGGKVFYVAKVSYVLVSIILLLTAFMGLSFAS